jgi:hypothetical protein
MIVEEHMAPLILDIEEDKEDTDHHADNYAHNNYETTIHPATSSEIVRFDATHPGKSLLLVLVF